jgi:D-alanyl-D-alanine carboxypeptidase/D-alanyl-D-alanine-endopeptidase (penicillin-binding protein 4)
LALATLLHGPALAQPDAAAIPLPAPVTQALQAAALSPQDLALAVLPLHGRWPTLLHRPDVPMQPGSTMKVVTSAVALEQLGPNHRGHTTLWATATAAGEVLRGPLVLQGGSDPEFDLAGLYALLLELREQGVRRIEGDLWLDRSRWQPGRPDRGVPPFDESPEFPYNVIPDPLHLAGALHALELRGESDRVTARLMPALPGVVLDNRLQPTDGRCSDWDGWETPTASVTGEGAAAVVTVVLQGRFPRQCIRRQALQLMDRDLLTERLVRRVWTDLGGTWEGTVREGVVPAGARSIARRDGRPWGELLRPLNKRSDNAWTRILFMEIGVAAGAASGGGTTAERGAAAVRTWFERHGIDPAGMVIDNGSGLSRSERLTARQLAQVLKVSLRGPNGADLLMSLPTAGVDGTMRNRLRGTPAAVSSRLKTGTLRNVTALAGQVTDAQGRTWVLAAVLNAEDAPRRGRAALDAFVAWVAEGGMTDPFGEGPGRRLDETERVSR